MGDYEKEQQRLLALWEDMESDDEVINNDDSEEEDIDNISVCSDYPDMEQDAEDELEPAEEQTQAKYFFGKDGTKWSKQHPNKKVRTRAENIIIHLPGVKKPAKMAKTPLECFSLFIDEQMIADIVERTNERITEKCAQWKDSPHYGQTSAVEIKAIFGLLYLSGVFRNNHRHLYELWNTDGTGMDIFPATMSQRRCEFLISCLRFDNKSNRAERVNVDKLAHIRAIFDRFVQNCQSAYSPSEYLTIDEKLESFRGKCSFRQFIPNKPARYGIKVHALVDARTYYVLNMEVYVGQQPQGPFRVSNKPKDIIDRLVAPVSKTNRNITFDNWYTSLELLQSLRQKHQLTAVGTIRKNKPYLPPAFLNVKNRDICSTLFGFHEGNTLVSYCPKKGKVVLLLSSLHHDDAVDQTDKKLPEVISFYNFTKCGVDVVDEMSASYNVSRNSRRWPLTLFYSLLNTTGINSQIIYRENNNGIKMARRHFLKKLGIQLVEAHQRSRMSNPRLTRELRGNIRKLLKELLPSEVFEYSEPLSKKRNFQQGRCSECPRAKDRKTRYVCEACDKFICLILYA
nr:piggyBac transposable element-derived protein 4-like [Onthophagus taurus]